MLAGLPDARREIVKDVMLHYWHERARPKTRRPDRRYGLQHRRAGDDRRRRRSRARRFLEFFAATIRNRNTRMAYYRAVLLVLRLARAARHRRARRYRAAPRRGLYRRRCRQPDPPKPTVKQHLAAIRMLFDWLVVGQVLADQPGACGARARSTSSSAARRRC